MARLIDAEKLIKAFEPEHYVDWYTPWIIDKINEQPTVYYLEVLHGKWKTEKGFNECSVCGYRDVFTPYCANCGAKMDGGDSNE